MRLLADCGNSSIKLAFAHDGGIWSHARVEPQAEALAGFAGSQLAALEELICLPGSAVHTALVERWWQESAPGRPLRHLGRELPLPALGQYPSCGADRVVAGLVAVRQEAAAVVVIDAGTATTLTAWTLNSLSTLRAGFAGGVILPGAHACAVGLSGLAPALPVVAPAASASSACQHDTIGALAAGLGIGYPAMVAACLQRLSGETGIDRLVITGGAAGLLIEAGLASRLAYRPTLVLEGIEELCRRQPRAG